MVNAPTKRRQQRATVNLRVKLKYHERQTFVERFAQNISRTGIFIRAKEPVATGTQVRFEYLLGNDTRVLRGLGVVRWRREASESSAEDKPPGMGIEFIDLDADSEGVIDEIVNRYGDGEHAPQNRSRASAMSSSPTFSASNSTTGDMPLRQLDHEEQGALDSFFEGSLGADLSSAEGAELEVSQNGSDLDPANEEQGITAAAAEEFDLSSLLKSAPAAPAAKGEASDRPPVTSEQSPQGDADIPAVARASTTVQVFVDLCAADVCVCVVGTEEPATRRVVVPQFGVQGGSLRFDKNGVRLANILTLLGTRWPSPRGEILARQLGLQIVKGSDNSASVQVGERRIPGALMVQAVLAAVVKHRPKDSSEPFRVIVPDNLHEATQTVLLGAARKLGIDLEILKESRALCAAADLGEQTLPMLILAVGRHETRLSLVLSDNVVTTALLDGGTFECDRIVARALAR
ncbi:MAG: TIGR02266 family protein [Myxococcota bacterium]